VLAVYSFTASFPKQETYGLALQMRRAAVSVPANIAEGFRKRGKADKVRFMNTAEGSLEECRPARATPWISTGYQGRSPCLVSCSVRTALPPSSESSVKTA
jgi:hypothetical protein